MYLDLIEKNNPALIRAAVDLHQSGAIPANTYVIDLGTVRRNARAMAQEAARVGLRLYLMTKHFNRNPLVTSAALAQGLDSTVAVDVQCALNLARFDLPVGHVGHLVQIPRHSLDRVLRMNPEVMTVFSVEKAAQVSEAAVRLGRVQDVMVRVRGPEDIIYPNEEGGIREEDLETAAKAIGALAGVRLAGVVTFPGTLYNTRSRRMETTANFETLLRARERLLEWGFDVTHVNGPGASCTEGFAVVAEAGGTVAEPGHALTGTTPSTLFNPEAIERQAIAYVSEVSHLFDGKAYVFGGGFYACDTPANVGDDHAFHTNAWTPRALVGRRPESVFSTKVPVDVGSFFGRTNNATDYYGGTLLPEGPSDIQVGDTVVYGFRPQVFTTRAFVAVLDDVDSTPRVLGVFDRANNVLNDDLEPCDDTRARVREMVAL